MEVIRVKCNEYETIITAHGCNPRHRELAGWMDVRLYQIEWIRLQQGGGSVNIICFCLFHHRNGKWSSKILHL